MFRVAVSKTVSCLESLSRWSQIKRIPTRNAYTLDAGGYNEKQAPFGSVQYFFQNTLPELGFNSEEEVTVMDVGCGQGLVTNQLIVPMFPNVTKIIAMDLFPGMIEFARAHYSHPKIEYGIANIEDWTTLFQWEGTISKLVSIHSFQWVQDQIEACDNIFRLLQPGGEAAFFMVLQSLFYDAMLKILRQGEWNEYFQDVDPFIAKSHTKGFHAIYYRHMMEEAGFTVLHAEEKIKIDTLPNDQVFRNFFASICVLVPHVPPERREEFKDVLFQHLLREGGRSCDGLPLHVGNMLELVVTKD